ncbi:MAG: hypothetical protein VB858_09115, partial [Planctomycetaceae bacterium]
MKLPHGWKPAIIRFAATCAVAAVTILTLTIRQGHSEESPSVVRGPLQTAAGGNPVTREATSQISHRTEEVLQYCADEAHRKLFDDAQYPSAKQCAQCHPGHYREWSVSP